MAGEAVTLHLVAPAEAGMETEIDELGVVLIRTVDGRSQEFLANMMSQGPLEDYLTDLESHHSETHAHSLRVALLCIDIGFENELSGTDLRTLGFAGLLHDLGKTEIDHLILSKASALDADERSAVDEHPRRGFSRLEESLYSKVRRVVIGHHEYRTGGFPRGGSDRRQGGREGSERRGVDATIPVLTQILAVADMCDALASERPYKKPHSVGEIRTILKDEFTGDSLYVEQALSRL